MNDQTDSTAAFEAVRSRLFGLAYRMLGSRADAEDVVQDAYVRWHSIDQSTVENTEAWLVTAATRLSIDRLRKLKTEREAYTGPWLPEPIVGDADRPDWALELSTDLSIAALTLLETLAPDERAAFLLHDVFDVDYDQISRIIGKNEPACRQMISRARSRVRGSKKRFESNETQTRALLDRFARAVDASDEQALLAMFAPDATWTADGGGKVPAGARPFVGGETIARLVVNLRRHWYVGRTFEQATVNGEPGLLMRDDGRVVAIMAFETDGDCITSVSTVLNPDKLVGVTGM